MSPDTASLQEQKTFLVMPVRLSWVFAGYFTALITWMIGFAIWMVCIHTKQHQGEWLALVPIAAGTIQFMYADKLRTQVLHITLDGILEYPSWRNPKPIPWSDIEQIVIARHPVFHDSPTIHIFRKKKSKVIIPVDILDGHIRSVYDALMLSDIPIHIT